MLRACAERPSNVTCRLLCTHMCSDLALHMYCGVSNPDGPGLILQVSLSNLNSLFGCWNQKKPQTLDMWTLWPRRLYLTSSVCPWIRQIQSCRQAFAAVLASGAVVTWGNAHPFSGSDSSPYNEVWYLFCRGCFQEVYIGKAMYCRGLKDFKFMVPYSRNTYNVFYIEYTSQ